MPVAPLTHTNGKKLCFCFETLSIGVGMKSIQTSACEYMDEICKE